MQLFGFEKFSDEKREQTTGRSDSTGTKRAYKRLPGVGAATGRIFLFATTFPFGCGLCAIVEIQA